MADEQLTALAREYAVEITKLMAKFLNEPGSLLNETIAINTEYVEDFLKWLSARFCIVEKSEIKEHYEDVVQDITNYKGEGMWGLGIADPTMCERAKGQKQMLLRLFGKELFKPEEK